MTSDQAGLLGVIVIVTPAILLAAYIVYDSLKREKKEKKS